MKEDKDEDAATHAFQLFSDLSPIVSFIIGFITRTMALRYFNAADTEKLWDKNIKMKYKRSLWK